MNKSSSCGCLNTSSVMPYTEINELSELKERNNINNEEHEITTVCNNICEFFNNSFYCDNKDIKYNEDNEHNKTCIDDIIDICNSKNNEDNEDSEDNQTCIDGIINIFSIQEK
jgi:hypothetical protein